jgi:hypothetical protein
MLTPNTLRSVRPSARPAPHYPKDVFPDAKCQLTNIVIRSWVLSKEGNGQRERSTIELCFTRNYGNKMRVRARGPTWVKSTWAWHTHETPSSNLYILFHFGNAPEHNWPAPTCEVYVPSSN